MLTKVTTITPVEVWMRLKDADLLKGQMRVQGHTTRSLAEAVECSRGFIGDLCRGAKNQCSSKNPGQNAKAKLAEKKNRTARRSAA
jgi:hypothetical protein